MWVPLVVLAVLSVVGGWINVHHEIAALPILGWVPHAEWLHYWLQPVTAQADAIIIAQIGTLSPTAPMGGGEGLWAYIAFAIAVAVIGVGSARLLGRAFRPAVDTPPPTGFNKVLYNKWYVDEIYDALIVRPILTTSRALWRWVDAAIIDGAVNGIASLSRLAGWAGARLQTGQINAYAFAVVIGALILIGFAVL
jgi:NADH-quinone oxidoreductase subunit L